MCLGVAGSGEIGRPIPKTPDIVLGPAYGIGKCYIQRRTAKAVPSSFQVHFQSCRDAGKVKSYLDGSLVTSIPSGAVTRKDHAGGDREDIDRSAAVGANGLIDDPLFVKSAGASIHMISKFTAGLSEEAAVQLAGGILLQYKKVKIL